MFWIYFIFKQPNQVSCELLKFIFETKMAALSYQTYTTSTTSATTTSGTTGEEYEVTEITRYVSPASQKWLENLFKDASKMSVTNQTVVGGLSGWCFGLLFAKVGKMAAATVGTSLLLLQIASHQGYVNVNWKKLGENAQKIRKAIAKDAEAAVPKLATVSQSFFEDNMLFASVFAGGFLLGLS